MKNLTLGKKKKKPRVLSLKKTAKCNDENICIYTYSKYVYNMIQLLCVKKKKNTCE